MIIFRSCKHCYYYNRVCGIGKGKIASLIVKKGDPKKFIEKDVSMSDLLPDFLVGIFPIVGGIILTVFDFSWLTIGMIVLIVISSFGGNAVIRGSLACKYCKQKKIGCPAVELFSKKKSLK